MERNRFFGLQYELARMYVPVKEAEFILSKREQLLHREAREVYEQLRDDERNERKYDEMLSYQYLRELFFVLSSKRSVIVERIGDVTHVPTNYLERDQFPWKATECVELSLRVRLGIGQRALVKQMAGIVEKKMRSFKTDFYFHDVLWMTRDMERKPFLWIVGTSHTFHEFFEAEEQSQLWADHLDSGDVERTLHGGDETWIGAALRVLAGSDDDYYYHDSTRLTKVSRDKFKQLHDSYVESVRKLTIRKTEKVYEAA